MGETVQWLETKEGAVVDRWRLDKKGCKKGVGSAKRGSNRTQSFIPRGQTGRGGCSEDAPVQWQRSSDMITCEAFVGSLSLFLKVCLF